MPADASSLLEAQLLSLLDVRAPADGLAWLRDTAGGIAAGDVDIHVAFPGVSRRIGRGGLGPPAGAQLEVTVAGARSSVPLAAWRIDDAARALLILAAARRDPGAAPGLVRTLYERGDARERIGALRALSLIGEVPGAADALPAVLDAVRTNQGEIFEAAVCENAFTSTLLPDHELRKAILKAVFVGLSIRRVLRLEERADATLTWSLLDLVTEREAASRPIAPELWPVMALFPPPGLAAKLLGYLEHPAIEQRAAAAAALGRLRRPGPAGPQGPGHDGDARVDSFLADRAAREPDAGVRAAIAAALADGT